MNATHLANLERTLSPHLPLSKARLETLCLLVLGMISARTVNLTHIACERSAPVMIASTYRRLQRFFQYVRLPEDWSVGLVITLIGRPQRWHLCLDRTNWKIGKSDVNVLVLAIVTERCRVPLMWTLLTHSGNSTTAQRIALMERYLARFDASTVRMLLADREFIGQEWFAFLLKHKIPFAIRLKEEQIIHIEGRTLSLRSWPSRCPYSSRAFDSFLRRCPPRPANPTSNSISEPDGSREGNASLSPRRNRSGRTASCATAESDGPSNACLQTARPGASTSKTRDGRAIIS